MIKTDISNFHGDVMLLLKSKHGYAIGLTDELSDFHSYKSISKELYDMLVLEIGVSNDS